jgi:heterogeneous nuclear ribonucleoprotein U-like protein 1
MLGFLYGELDWFINHKVSNVTYSLMQQTAVVVFPTPSELKSRAAKQFDEMGKEVPAEAVNEMTGTWTYTHYYFTLK